MTHAHRETKGTMIDTVWVSHAYFPTWDIFVSDKSFAQVFVESCLVPAPVR